MLVKTYLHYQLVAELESAELLCQYCRKTKTPAPLYCVCFQTDRIQSAWTWRRTKKTWKFKNEKRCSSCPVWPRQPHSSSKLPCPLTPHISSPSPYHMASLGLRSARTTNIRLYFVGLLQALLQTLLFTLTVFCLVISNLSMQMVLSYKKIWTFDLICYSYNTEDTDIIQLNIFHTNRSNHNLWCEPL